MRVFLPASSSGLSLKRQQAVIPASSHHCGYSAAPERRFNISVFTASPRERQKDRDGAQDCHPESAYVLSLLELLLCGVMWASINIIGSYRCSRSSSRIGYQDHIAKKHYILALSNMLKSNCCEPRCFIPIGCVSWCWKMLCKLSEEKRSHPSYSPVNVARRSNDQLDSSTAIVARLLCK